MTVFTSCKSFMVATGDKDYRDTSLRGPSPSYTIQPPRPHNGALLSNVFGDNMPLCQYPINFISRRLSYQASG